MPDPRPLILTCQQCGGRFSPAHVCPGSPPPSAAEVERLFDLLDNSGAWYESAIVEHGTSWHLTIEEFEAYETACEAARVAVSRLVRAKEEAERRAEEAESDLAKAHDWGEAQRDAKAALAARAEFLETCGIIELMIANPNADSYVREWEARTLKAEARVEALEGALREIEAHHVAANQRKRRDENRSTTLRIVRQVLG